MIGIIGTRFWKVLYSIVTKLSFFLNTIPALVLLFWLHYPLQQLLHIVIDPFWTTVLALGLMNLVATADLIGRELVHFPESYRDVGKTLGLSTMNLIRHIELPIISRRTIPQLLTNQAKMLEYTLFASLISVPELFRVAQNINSLVYKPVEIYSLLVLFFFLLLGPLHLIVHILKKRYVV